MIGLDWIGFVLIGLDLDGGLRYLYTSIKYRLIDTGGTVCGLLANSKCERWMKEFKPMSHSRIDKNETLRYAGWDGAFGRPWPVMYDTSSTSQYITDTIDQISVADQHGVVEEASAIAVKQNLQARLPLRA